MFQLKLWESSDHKIITFQEQGRVNEVRPCKTTRTRLQRQVLKAKANGDEIMKV